MNDFILFFSVVIFCFFVLQYSLQDNQIDAKRFDTFQLNYRMKNESG